MMKRRRIGQEGQAVKFDRKNGKTGNCELTPLDCDKHFPIKALWKFFCFVLLIVMVSLFTIQHSAIRMVHLHPLSPQSVSDFYH